MLEIGLFEGCDRFLCSFNRLILRAAHLYFSKSFPKGLLRRIDSGRHFGGLGL